MKGMNQRSHTCNNDLATMTTVYSKLMRGAPRARRPFSVIRASKWLRFAAPVLVLATDTSGNTNTCVFTVTVMENPPQLSISQSGTNLTLSWPQSCLNYAVEEKASLDPTAPWGPLGITPTPVGNSYQVMLQTGNGTQFFRLNGAR